MSLLAGAMYALDGALRQQGYRPLDVATLTEAGALDLRAGLPDELTAILSGVCTNPAWQEIAHQLALLPNRDRGSFAGIYLGVRKNLLCLATVYVYEDPRRLLVLSPGRSRQGVDEQRWRPDFEWVWDTLRFLEPAVGRFRLAPEWGPAVRTAVDAYGDVGGATGAALSLLASAVQLSTAARGPCGTFIGVAMDGFEPQLADRIRNRRFLAMKNVLNQVPGLAAYGWDPERSQLLGNGLSDGLEKASLERSLQRGLTIAAETPGLHGPGRIFDVPRRLLEDAARGGSAGRQPALPPAPPPLARPELPAVPAPQSEGPAPPADPPQAPAAPPPAAPPPASPPSIAPPARACQTDAGPGWWRCGACSHVFLAGGRRFTCPNCRTQQVAPS